MQSSQPENILQQPIQQVEIETKIDNPPVTAAQPDEEGGDVNWKRFREQRKKERAEKEAAERRAAEKEQEVIALKAAMEAAFSRQQPSAAPVDQYGYAQEETEEQRIDKKISAALAARDEQYRREAAQREAQEYPQRLKHVYPDFDQVVSQENLDYLDYHFKEVSNPLQRLENGYDKWADIYRAVKKFVPNHANAKKDAARAEANFNKPKSMSSMGAEAPMAQGAPMLSKDRRAENWERMQKTLKGVS